VLTDNSGLSPFERLLTLFTRVRPGEGRSTFLFFLHGFLLLFSYFIVRVLRDAFILTDYSAEVRSYGYAVVALVRMFVVPAYGAVRRRLDGARLLQAVTLFFALNMLGFSAAAYFGSSTSFTFFVWVSIFGTMMIAQFWAFAADTFNLKSGQRLFPVIMVGANLGALAGDAFAAVAAKALHPLGLMMVATLVLAATVVLAGPARAATPEGSRSVSPEHGTAPPKLLGGIELVLRDRYLLMVALLIVLLNWINTTGGTLLADMASRDADARVAASAGTLAKDVVLTAFYGDYSFWTTLVGLAIQLLLVARVYRWVGIRGALLVLPVIAALGYGLMAFVPIFSIIRLVKIGEGAGNGLRVDATRPQPHVRESIGDEILDHHLGRRHDGPRWPMESPQPCIAPRQRQPEPGVHVFREARVIGRGERKVVVQREAPRRHAERTFGGDVQHVRVELANGSVHPGLREQRKPDLWIGRARQRAEFQRREEAHFVAHRGELAGGGLERANHAVDLRLPGVCDEENSQKHLRSR
jgi:AAA family ATP:ADP antiporter